MEEWFRFHFFEAVGHFFPLFFFLKPLFSSKSEMANFRKVECFFRYFWNVQLFNNAFENCIGQARYVFKGREWIWKGKIIKTHLWEVEKQNGLGSRRISKCESFHPRFAWLAILDVGMDRHFLGLRLQQSFRALGVFGIYLMVHGAVAVHGSPNSESHVLDFRRAIGTWQSWCEHFVQTILEILKNIEIDEIG